eukprot:459215_1
MINLNNGIDILLDWMIYTKDYQKVTNIDIVVKNVIKNTKYSCKDFHQLYCLHLRKMNTKMSCFINTDREMLFTGFIKQKCDTKSFIIIDIISLIDKYSNFVLYEQWDTSLINYHLQFVGQNNNIIKFKKFGSRRRKSNNHNLCCAFGTKIISIGTHNKPTRTIEWKLKLHSTANHMCCGIGIININDCRKVHNAKLKLPSSNLSVLSAQKTACAHNSLIGFQCGSFHIHDRKYINGHIINDKKLLKTTT